MLFHFIAYSKPANDAVVMSLFSFADVIDTETAITIQSSVMNKVFDPCRKMNVKQLAPMLWSEHFCQEQICRTASEQGFRFRVQWFKL